SSACTVQFSPVVFASPRVMTSASSPCHRTLCTRWVINRCVVGSRKVARSPDASIEGGTTSATTRSPTCMVGTMLPESTATNWYEELLPAVHEEFGSLTAEA